jgi:multidrug efflux pump subunit AcrA (membrane-fusion protein)
MKLTFKTFLIPVAILVVGFLLMRLLLSFREEPEKRKPLIRPKLVDAKLVNLEDVPTEIIAYGRLTSAQPVILYSEVAGIIEKGDIAFQPAQSFKKGDLLLKIDTRQIHLDLNSTKADFLTALASVLPEIKVDFPDEFPVWQEYFDKCGFDRKLPPLPETNNQKIKLFLSRFNVYKLYFQVSGLEIRLSKHFFYAPFNGSIISTDLRAGSTAREGTRLGELINLENLEVEVPVPAQDIQWIDQSRPVIFTSSEVYGQWSGKIKRIGKNIDEQTQSVPVFTTVNKNGNDNLYNGVFLKAQIPGKIISHAFSIPRRAIYNDKFIYLIQNGKLDYREINIARKETETVILNQGIANGDTVVVELMQGVAPGMPAKIRHSE